MIVPVGKESFDFIAKSSNNIIEFIKGLKKDDKVKSAIRSIPNMDSYLEGGDVEPILVAMTAQDIINCLDSLFGEVKLTSKGGSGLYAFFYQLKNNDPSYFTYTLLTIGGIEDDISDNISLFRNWGLNATTEEFKLAILLSKVNRQYLKRYWELIYKFGYCVVKAESKISNETISTKQQNYLNDILLRAQKYFEDSSIDFLTDCKKIFNSNEGELLPTIPYICLKQEGELHTYTILKDKIIDYIIDTINSKGSKETEIKAKNLRKGGLDIELLYIIPKHYWEEHLIADNKNIVEGEILCVLKCKYKGDNKSLKGVDFPLIRIKVPTTGYFILSDFSVIRGIYMDDDIKFQIKKNKSDRFICYDKFFNIYEYRKVSSNILKKTEPYSDSLNVELHWNYRNGNFVHKNEILGYIKVESLEIESEFIALSDGYFFIGTKSFCGYVNKSNLLIPNEGTFSQECLLYSLYPNKASWIAEICYNFKITEYKDDFNDQLNLKWEIVANRYTNYLRTQGFPAFEMTSTKGICIYLSLEYLNEKAYIVFGVKSTDIKLRQGDMFSLLLRNEGNKKILDFSILNNPTQTDSPDIKEYDKLYYFEIFYEDIDILESYNCTNWRITFANNRRTAIDGLNESSWTPSFIAGEVLRLFASTFKTELSKRNIKIEHHKTAKVLKEDFLNIDNSCSVYLMHDTTNNFYKIGISNNPKYRERTLQGEKPTIEIVCYKEFPIRSIAEAFESALHRTFAKKRIRGEWFSLDETDVIILIKTLS